MLEVAAAGVNRADLLQRAGHYPPPPGASPILGLEASGTVLEVGADVTAWRPGDRVTALLDGGGYAERVAVPQGRLLPIPRGVGLVEAAALPEAACTAWATLLEVAGLRAGQTVLVHGGSGGVGSLAVQLARALGARVVATAGGPERTLRCRELGAEVAVDHRAQDFVAAVREATGGAGADIVLDVIGADYLERNLAAVADDGVLVVIGLQRGRRAELDLGTLLTRRATVAGTTLRARPAAQKDAVVLGVRDQVWPLVEDGAIRPVVHAVLPFAEAEAAHGLLQSGQAFGKVLLTP